MFERRLKIFFGILAAMVALLLGRAAELQIVQAKDWQTKAENALRKSHFLDPVRGPIVDRKGRILAEDRPCMDAAVDFRAIDRDPDWMKQIAVQRLTARGDEYRKAGKKERENLIEGEVQRLGSDLDQMWIALSRETRHPLSEIQQTLQDIRIRVNLRKRLAWYHKYSVASAEHQKDQQKDEPWYRAWLSGNGDGPQLESFDVPISDEVEPQVVVSNVPEDSIVRLKKMTDLYPGLVLIPGKHRVYPYGEAACHVIGYVTPVTRDDMREKDPHWHDELRQRQLNDQIGRTGVEALCDQALRGVRGKIEVKSGGEEASRLEPEDGKTVRVSIDIELQRRIEKAFKDVQFTDDNWRPTGEHHEMHGAAVVLDVATGEVLALVSNPGFDPNTISDDYPRLAFDGLNSPLMNRATRAQLEPGSTAKPMVGLGAMTDGKVRPDETIECKGYMYINGVAQPFGKCWTVKLALSHGMRALIAHHQLGGPPHPDGHLTFPDAIQRSCNVWFETVGQRLGAQRLGYWFRQFGLGQPTGIGIGEASGWVPDEEGYVKKHQREIPLSEVWFSSIGQDMVRATPIQMANEAATIARDGIWLRPTLVPPDVRSTLPQGPDRRDLHLLPEALAMAKEGMRRVVNTRAGSAYPLRRDDMILCGKTGTAQVGYLHIPVIDPATGKPKVASDGTPVYEPPNTPEHPNPRYPWYRAANDSTLPSHAWFICFAPMDHPQIAFSVVLEYGGSGGRDAGPITKAVLDALVDLQYLRPAK